MSCRDSAITYTMINMTGHHINESIIQGLFLIGHSNGSTIRI